MTEYKNYSSNSFPQDIKNIITRLRITVDHIDSPRNYARDLIHELARQLDERRLCQRGRISIKIKEILKDKIQVGKITKEWISECLPEDYKRKYTKSKIKSKSKLSLLSNQDKDKDAKQDQEELAVLKEEVLVRASGEEAAVKPEGSAIKTREVGNDTDTSPLPPELRANTNAYEPGSMTASPTLPQSIDTHVTEDSMSMDKSPADISSAGEIRIKKLEDENKELRIRCQRTESNNTKLVLQLTRQGKYINELLNQDQNAVNSNNSQERISLINQLEETPADKEITTFTDEIELTIVKEKYPSLEEAMHKE